MSAMPSISMSTDDAVIFMPCGSGEVKPSAPRCAMGDGAECSLLIGLEALNAQMSNGSVHLIGLASSSKTQGR